MGGDGAPRDRVAWLERRLAEGTLSRARVELVARLGDADAATALGVTPGDADLYAHGDPVFPTLPVTDQVVVLAHALEGLARWWRRAARPFATDWAAGPDAAGSERALEAGRHVVRFYEVIPPDAGGPDPATYERALTHVAHAAGLLAYVCAPPDAPFRAPTQWEPAPPRPTRTEEAERQVRADQARGEVVQAIWGRAYVEALPRSEPGYEDRVEARARAARQDLRRTLVTRLLA